MFRKILSLGMFVTIFSVTAHSAVAWRGGGGWGQNGQYGRLFDPKTVETIKGTVTEIDTTRPMKGMSNGVHLSLQTDAGLISVHLGPEWFVERQEFKILKNDVLEIKGSRVTLNSKPVVIAAEIRKSEDLLKLRDESGSPIWSGWRRDHR